MQTTELLAFDAAPDFVGPPPPPLRLVEQPPPRTPERQALADIVSTTNAIANSIAQLETQERRASLSVAAAQAAKDVAGLDYQEAKRTAAEDVLAMLRSEVPRGMAVTGYDVNTIHPDGARLSGGGVTVGLVEARQAVEACRDMFDAAVSARKIITRQLAAAQKEMAKMILIRRDAVWAAVAADPVVQAIRQRHADVAAILVMLQSIHCHPAGPSPEPRSEVTAAWVGILNELAAKPDTPLPAMEE